MTKSRHSHLQPVLLFCLCLSAMGGILIMALQPSPAVAQCTALAEDGMWFISNALKSPYRIKIRLFCGDVRLCDENGDCVEPKTGPRVMVSEKQRDGTLYNRPEVWAEYAVSARGTKWLLAEVPTGGYVDHMQMHMVEKDGEKYLHVLILHKSLDSKPDANSDLWFRRTPPGAPIPFPEKLCPTIS